MRAAPVGQYMVKKAESSRVYQGPVLYMDIGDISVRSPGEIGYAIAAFHARRIGVAKGD